MAGTSSLELYVSYPTLRAGDMESDDETPTNRGGLYLGPVRRPLNADSEFFDAGNINRALLCKINVFAVISGGGDAMDFHDQRQTFKCMFHGCSSTFSSLERVGVGWSSCVGEMQVFRVLDYTGGSSSIPTAVLVANLQEQWKCSPIQPPYKIPPFRPFPHGRGGFFKMDLLLKARERYYIVIYVCYSAQAASARCTTL